MLHASASSNLIRSPCFSIISNWAFGLAKQSLDIDLTAPAPRLANSDKQKTVFHFLLFASAAISATPGNDRGLPACAQSEQDESEKNASGIARYGCVPRFGLQRGRADSRNE